MRIFRDIYLTRGLDGVLRASNLESSVKMEVWSAGLTFLTDCGYVSEAHKSSDAMEHSESLGGLESASDSISITSWN